jgi:hypothetical protein
MAARICKYFLKYLAMVYAKGASLLGVWNAQQLAAQNEADPLAKLDTTGSTTESDSWHFGIYTLGVSSSPMDIFMLPLEPSATTSRAKPWHQSANELSLFKNSTTPWKQIYSIMGTPDGWDVDPYVSKRGTQEGLGMSGGKVTDDSTLPTPAVWIAFKLGKNIQTLPLDGFWNANDKDRWTHKLPMFAVAAAQCITGDVVPHSNKKSGENPNNQRPAGFGAGATAKLVPVSEVFYKIKDGAGTTVDALIYH